MRIQLNNAVYDTLSRFSRYYIPLVGTIFALTAWIFELPDKASVLTGLVYIQMFVGFTLLLARSRWRTKDSLIIDDRDPEEITFGFESGRRFEDLHHNKIMTLRIRKLAEESRDTFGAYSDQ